MNIGSDGKFDLTKIKAGGITADEFATIAKSNPKLIKIFNKADKDSNGILSENELSTILSNFTIAAGDNAEFSRKERKVVAAQYGEDVKAKDIKRFIKALDEINDNSQETKTVNEVRTEASTKSVQGFKQQAIRGIQTQVF